MSKADHTVKVQKGEYTAVQATNCHILIFRDGHMVMHSVCTQKKTKAELLEQIDHYIAFAESGMIEKMFQDSFGDKEVPVG